MAISHDKHFIADAIHFEEVETEYVHDFSFEVVYDFESRDLWVTLEYLGTGKEAVDDLTCRVKQHAVAREGIEYAAFEKIAEMAREDAIRHGVFSRRYLDKFSGMVRVVADTVDAYLYAC